MNSEKYVEYQKCGNLIDFYHHIMKECNQIIKYNQFLKSLYSILETFTNEKELMFSGIIISIINQLYGLDIILISVLVQLLKG